MSPLAPNLDRIRVQTARMMEMYGLLQRDLEKSQGNALKPEDRLLLSTAIASIEANMRQLLAHFAAAREQSSQEPAEAQELEELVNAVLEWCADQKEGE